MTISSKGLLSATTNIITLSFWAMVLIGTPIMAGFAIIIVMVALFAAFGVQYNVVLVQFYSDVLGACMELMCLILVPLMFIVGVVWLVIKGVEMSNDGVEVRISIDCGYFIAKLRDIGQRLRQLRFVAWNNLQGPRPTIERAVRLLGQCDCLVEVEVREGCGKE